jgi:hypothetical protein
MNPVKWVKDRVDERTSWDGAVLIACGIIVLIAGPLAKLAAWGARGRNKQCLEKLKCQRCQRSKCQMWVVT